jgi:hypothetical protein
VRTHVDDGGVSPEDCEELIDELAYVVTRDWWEEPEYADRFAELVTPTNIASILHRLAVLENDERRRLEQ